MNRGQHQSRPRVQRILAVYPTHRGYGYAVVEHGEVLIDWGVCQVRTDKTERTLQKVSELIRRCEPDVVVVEATRHENCRRRENTRFIIDGTAALAESMNVAVRRVVLATVRAHYADLGAKNKDAAARIIVGWYPELGPYLPPRRKSWMPEDERMSVFDAVSMALVVAGVETSSGSRTPS